METFHCSSNNATKRLSYLWQPYLRVDKAGLRSSLLDTLPSTVVVEGGIWFLWLKKDDIKGFGEKFNELLDNLVELKQELKV